MPNQAIRVAKLCFYCLFFSFKKYPMDAEVTWPWLWALVFEEPIHIRVLYLHTKFYKHYGMSSKACYTKLNSDFPYLRPFRYISTHLKSMWNHIIMLNNHGIIKIFFNYQNYYRWSEIIAMNILYTISELAWLIIELADKDVEQEAAVETGFSALNLVVTH